MCRRKNPIDAGGDGELSYNITFWETGPNMRKITVIAVVVGAGCALGTILALLTIGNPDRNRGPSVAKIAPPTAAPAPVRPVAPTANEDEPVQPPAPNSEQPKPIPPAAVAPGASEAPLPAGKGDPPPPNQRPADAPLAGVWPSGAVPANRSPRPSPAPGRPGEAPQVPAQPGVGGAEPIIPLPLARSALGYVGGDPEAEVIWVNAINDPALPPNARKDLIEDLNEEGFPDLKNLTEEDLPLIQSRIELIESMAEDAMDDVNAAAFAEAYKDLINMRRKVTGM
jgi:hypothetical protein